MAGRGARLAEQLRKRQQELAEVGREARASPTDAPASSTAPPAVGRGRAAILGRFRGRIGSAASGDASNPGVGQAAAAGGAAAAPTPAAGRGRGALFARYASSAASKAGDDAVSFKSGEFETSSKIGEFYYNFHQCPTLIKVIICHRYQGGHQDFGIQVARHQGFRRSLADAFVHERVLRHRSLRGI